MHRYMHTNVLEACLAMGVDEKLGVAVAVVCSLDVYLRCMHMCACMSMCLHRFVCVVCVYVCGYEGVPTFPLCVRVPCVFAFLCFVRVLSCLNWFFMC